MSDYSTYMNQARKEVDSCLETWKSILEENYSKSIEYAYAKGSATKKWESYIDYVPVLSDVDIHIKVLNHSNFFDDENSFHESVNISETYETRFIEDNPNYFHIPRTQIICINKIVDIVDFVFPKETSIIPLIGDVQLGKNPSIDRIKETDLKNLLKLEELLAGLPMSMIDRTGMDLWSLIRRMNWRISPSPVRLLSLSSDKPLDLWELNRTSIAKELEKHDYPLIAEHYKDYYYEGWIAFLEDFTNSQTLRRLISTGHEVLKLCLDETRKLIV